MANDYTTVQVKGLSELAAALRDLPDRIARNALRGATAAGAAVIRKEAVRRAPVYHGDVAAGHPKPGTLKRALYQVQSRELSGLVQQVFVVGVRTGKARQAVEKKRTIKGKRAVVGVENLDAYYWRFVEFGTSKMAARPFMRPAFEAKKTAAVEAIRQYLAERIPREAAKLTQGPRI
jgi:HK97 gp10 family phage protein